MKTETEIFLEKLGKRITEIRKAKGLSQNEMALRMLSDKPNIRKLERGSRNATVGTLLKVCESLEVSMSELFNF